MCGSERLRPLGAIATFAKSAFWIAPKVFITAVPRLEAVIRAGATVLRGYLAAMQTLLPFGLSLPVTASRAKRLVQTAHHWQFAAIDVPLGARRTNQGSHAPFTYIAG